MSQALEIVREVSAETGTNWNEESMLEIMSQYIDNQNSLDAFEDFIRNRAKEENKEGVG